MGMEPVSGLGSGMATDMGAFYPGGLGGGRGRDKTADMLLPLLLPMAHADPDPLLRPEDRVAVLQALSAADMTVADLSWQKDYVQADGVRRDPWRLPGIEGLLNAPLTVPDDAARWSGGLSAAQGDPLAALQLAIRALGIEVPPPATVVTGCQPAEKRAWKQLDPQIRQAVCDLVTVSAATPRRASPGWVPAEVEDTIRTSLSPDGEDAWDATEAQRRTRALLASLDGIDLRGRLSQAEAGLAELLDLERKLPALPAEAWPAQLQRLTFGDRVVEIGSPGADAFSAPLTLDPGGDDTHQDPECDGLSAHLDLAGDDTWRGDTGALGGAVGGVSLLVDLAGNDTYRAGKASLGAGVGGAGVLVDRAGDDSYRGVATTQGAGVIGVGLLMDGAGTDTYDAAAYAQGYAGVRGVGALWEGGGDDLYRAGGTYPDMPTRLPEHTLSLSQGFSIGLRPDAGGGLGLLLDEAGNDAYDADLFAQGCSYWFSRGYLIDRSGNDRYHTFQYGQGSGIHLSVGGLFDLAGQDAYTGGNIVQGSSHDLSVGWLIDRSGDDLYIGNSTAQAGSLTNSATFLLDAAGDDAYLYRQPASRGMGRYDRNMGSVGVFVDVAGDDRYDEHMHQDAVERPWAWGVVVDDSNLLPPPDPETPPPALRPLHAPGPDPASSRPQPDAQALADLAAADSVDCKDPPACEKARADLAKGGPETFARLLPALPRDILQEGYTLDAVFRLTRSPDNDPKLRQILLDHLAAGPAYPAERWLVGWLADLGLDPAGTAALLAPLAKDESPRLRNAVATALLTWKIAPPILDDLLRDPDEGVRAVSALALGAGGGSPERLVALLRDDSVLVRFNAAQALLARPAESVRPALLAAWKTGNFPTPAARRLALDLLIRVGGKETDAIVRSVAAGDADPWARRKAASALAGEAPFPWHP